MGTEGRLVPNRIRGGPWGSPINNTSDSYEAQSALVEPEWFAKTIYRYPLDEMTAKAPTLQSTSYGLYTSTLTDVDLRREKSTLRWWLRRGMFSLIEMTTTGPLWSHIYGFFPIVPFTSETLFKFWNLKQTESKTTPGHPSTVVGTQ